MLFLPFLVSLAHQQPAPHTQEQTNLLQQVIGQPTGRNGYEQYVAASQIALSSAYRTYDSYKSPEKITKDQPPVLDVWKQQVEKFSQIGGLVTQGNSMPVYDPRARLVSKSTPEYAGFPGVEDYFVHGAYTSLANGDPQAAARGFEQGLYFAANLDNGTLPGGAIAEECQKRIFMAIVKALPKLGVRELDRLADASSQVLKAPSSVVTNFQALKQADQVLAEALLRNRDIGGGVPGGLATMNAEQKVRVLRLFLSQEDACLQTVADLASGPESKWDMFAFVDSDPAIRMLSRQSMGVNPHPLVASAKFRTRVRILRLMVRVFQYRWLNDRFPASLAEVTKSSELADPLSDAAFNYSHTEDAVNIASIGTEWTGPVAIG